MRRNEIIAVAAVLLLIAGVTLFTLMSRSRDKKPQGKSPATTRSLPTPLPPPAVGDPVRLRQTYVPGKIYRATTDYKLQVPGQHTRWGLRKEMILLLTGRFSYELQVLENDGEEMVFELSILTSRFMQMAFDANIEIELDQAVKDAIQMTTSFYGLPMPQGALEVSQKQINDLLKQTRLDSRLVEELLKPEQLMQQVESLEGAVVRMRYLDGRGVRDFEVIRHQSGEGVTFEQLSRDEQSFLMNFHPFPDPYIFPNEEVETGGNWVVRGSTLPVQLPMVLAPRVDGEVVLSRQSGEGTAVPLKVEEGKLYLQGATVKGHQLNADWTPRGSFTYDSELRVVSKARLSGAMTYASGGKDFWVLQVSQSARPDYELEYSCEVREAPRP